MAQERPKIYSFHELFKFMMIIFVIASLVLLLFFGLFVYSAMMLRYENGGDIIWNVDHYEAQINITNYGIFPVHYMMIGVEVENATGHIILSGYYWYWEDTIIGVGMTSSTNLPLTNSSPITPGTYNITIYFTGKMANIEQFRFNYKGEVTIT